MQNLGLRALELSPKIQSLSLLHCLIDSQLQVVDLEQGHLCSRVEREGVCVRACGGSHKIN